jgi:biopolymer transport protein ExbD
MGRNRTTEGCEIDMTPMIDVVFQLIIFFIVTIQMEKNYKEDIELADSPHGPAITSKQQVRTMVIEVDKRGDVSIHSVPLTVAQFRSIMITRYKNYGEFPVLIRGDRRTPHKDVRRVMDICSGIGIWRINFAAIKEHKAEN